MKTFSDYLDRQDRDNKDHLGTLKRLYKEAGFEVANHLNDRKDPYLFVRKPNNDFPEMDALTFHGVRVYARGKDIIAYRCQNKETTEPFGEAYILDVKGMYKSLVKEHMQQKKAGHKLCKFLVEELLNFFLQSVEAENQFEPEDTDKFGSVAVIGGTGTDYSTSVQTPGIGSSAGR